MSVKAVRRTGGGTDGVSAGRSALSARKNAPTLESSNILLLDNNQPAFSRTSERFASQISLKSAEKYLCISANISFRK